MSLFLGTCKKSQQAQSAQGEEHASRTSELSLEERLSQVVPEPDTRPIENARGTGQNLFATKSSYLTAERVLPNRNLLFARGGTLLLLAIGAGYFWYLDSSSNTAPLRQFAVPLVQAAPSVAVTEPVVPPVPEIAEPNAAGTIQETRPSGNHVLSETRRLKANGQAAPAPVANLSARTPQARSSTSRPASAAPMRIEQHISEPQVDPLLNDAYLAYRNGKLDEAHQLYLAMLKKDAWNIDALLGLATLAQQREETPVAAQYYARVLALDPRNAPANAGMSALSADSENNESRLKNLLREQGNSTALHFALGNLYAAQSRWGEAQQAYFNAYMLESGNAGFAFNLAVSLDHLGQGKLAAQHYQRALQLDASRGADFDHAQISQRIEDLIR